VKVKLKDYIRSIPDFPVPGIMFRDITTLLKEPLAFNQAIKELAAHYKGKRIDLVVAVESRGFIFGAPLAHIFNAGFIPVRKAGKLPARTTRVDYALEYGDATLEMHLDAIQPGHKVLIVDDLLATGGTADAARQLVEKNGGEVVGFAFVIELDALQGRKKLPGYDVFSLVHYED